MKQFRRISEDDFQEAIKIIENLLSYGRIYTVEGVSYPAGTHDKMLNRADLWLWNNRENNHVPKP